MDIGPGDVVECVQWLGIDIETGGPSVAPPLVIGRLYTVEAIGTHPVCPGLFLVGMTARSADCRRYSYDPSCFRKRPPHREALFRSLLEPTQQIIEDD